MSIEAMKKALKALEHLGNQPDAFVDPASWNAAKAKDACIALRTAIQQAESDPVGVAAPHIAMGFGRYEVGSGTYQGTPCIAFGKNGTGKVGEFVTMEPRQMSAEETVAVITFANVDGLDVLQEKVDEVRALHFPDTHPNPGVPEFSRTAIQQAEAKTDEPVGVPDALKDHQIAAMVNTLRDIARQFHGHDSLRERIANVLVPALKAEAQQPATPEPVLYIHPSTFEMNNAHVGAWKPGHELPGYIPLFTHPAPVVPDDVVRDAKRWHGVVEAVQYIGEHPVWTALCEAATVPVEPTKGAVDAAVDAAMTASQAQKGGAA